MKVKIVDLENRKVGEMKLPSQFDEEYRPDIIARAVLAIQSHNRQPYGASSEAGKRASAKLSRRRRDYKTAYGYGISRVPRKILTRRGTRFNWVGAFAPGTVGGRRAHPPKSEKIFYKKINTKERLKAIKSAIAATMVPELVSERGHKVPQEFPFIVDGKFENLDKTKSVVEVLIKFGFDKELERGKLKKVRAGKGKSRGRRYKKKKSILIVTSKDSAVAKTARNIPGIDVVDVKNLNAETLAPGAKAGRLTLWTKEAIELMEKENLFML